MCRDLYLQNNVHRLHFFSSTCANQVASFLAVSSHSASIYFGGLGVKVSFRVSLDVRVMVRVSKLVIFWTSVQIRVLLTEK